MADERADEAEGSRVFLMRLKHELQYLASPSRDQMEIHRALSGAQPEAPPGLGDPGWRDALAAEEAGMRLDEWKSAVMARMGDALTVGQRGWLAALDAYFGEMNGLDSDHLWTPEALASAPEWADLRRIARSAAGSFGWAVEPPSHLGRALSEFPWRDELPELPTPEARS